MCYRFGPPKWTFSPNFSLFLSLYTFDTWIIIRPMNDNTCLPWVCDKSIIQYQPVRREGGGKFLSPNRYGCYLDNSWTVVHGFLQFPNRPYLKHLFIWATAYRPRNVWSIPEIGVFFPSNWRQIEYCDYTHKSPVWLTNESQRPWQHPSRQKNESIIIIIFIIFCIYPIFYHGGLSGVERERNG